MTALCCWPQKHWKQLCRRQALYQLCLTGNSTAVYKYELWIENKIEL